jgi:L-asparaginase II
MLEKIGATEAELHCGPHPPLGEAQARALAARGPVLGRPTKLHNNCSGKHAGMLASCRAYGFPLADYNRLHHPLQQEILGHLAAITELARDQIQTAVDGCGAVVFRTPLDALARAYQRLCSDDLPPPHREAGRRIRAAVAAAPELIAGPLRLCTDLSRVTGGRVFGKIGAEGVYGLGVTGGPHGPAGLAVKIQDGNGKLLGPLLCAVLSRLGWLGPEELQGLAAHASWPIRNHQSELVGDVRVCIVEL